MSLTDVGKRLHRWSVERFCGAPIVFVHVPKCGGTSVGRALRRAYILSQGTVKPHESAEAFEAVRSRTGTVNGVFELREMMLLYLLYCDTRCVAAHVPFSQAAHANFGSSYSFVTMLRDPVDRFLSNYHWNQRESRPNRSHEPLTEFLKTERARQAGSTYVRYFCGEPGLDDFTSSHTVRAVANLGRLDLVGFLDHIGDFQARLRVITGRRISIGMENVRKVSGRRRSDLPDSVRKRLFEICAPDREVWNAVREAKGLATGVEH